MPKLANGNWKLISLLFSSVWRMVGLLWVESVPSFEMGSSIGIGGSVEDIILVDYD